MIALEQIMVPTDFSKPSEIALHYAKELARNFKASLHVVHVLEPMQLMPLASPGGTIPGMYSLRDEWEKRVHEQLGKMLNNGEREQFRAKLLMLTGSPFVEIIRYARSQSIDLIVMGTHGRGPISHMLIGSVAERVVRKAPCPVLTVRHPEHEFVMP
jgi:nucleotide-binding universal stress UspA family protein